MHLVEELHFFLRDHIPIKIRNDLMQKGGGGTMAANTTATFEAHADCLLL